jgi:hypothetical protein
MFDLRRQRNPRVLAILVHRNRRRWKGRLCKSSHRHGNELLAIFETPVNSGSAAWTEVKGDSAAFIADADILMRLAFDFHGLGPKACLGAKYTAGAALALQTVTDGHSDRLFGNRDGELTATTRCGSRWHNDSISG